VARRRDSTSANKRRFRKDQPWRRYFRTTREGKVFIAVTAGVGLAAINTGNNLLFLIFGFMLSLIVLSGILSEIGLRNVRVRRKLPERAFAGATTLVEIGLQNNKTRAPSYSLEVEDLVAGQPSERRCYFLKVAPQAEQVAAYRRAIPKRGVLVLEGFRVATRYPFGIIEKWRMIEQRAELLVYPALLRQDVLDAGYNELGAESESARIGPGTEIAGLRNYQPGDGARAIHWRRTAALGRLMVYEKHTDSSSHLTVVLDNARPDGTDPAWDEGFERAISRAAALAVAAAGRELSVEVVCRGQRSPIVLPGSPADPVLRFLALLHSVPIVGAPPLELSARDARVIRIAVERAA
jgi:uncharacterized protein (DUF58 family)